jgi:hypothetical protein
VGGLDALEVVFECLEHGPADLLQFPVVLLVEVFGNRVAEEGSGVSTSRQLGVEAGHVLHLEGLPHLHRKHHLKGLALLGVLQLKRSTLAES